MVIEHDYCGCCGTEIPTIEFWCKRCRGHVLNDGPPWDRTYYAQHGTDCPYQV